MERVKGGRKPKKASVTPVKWGVDGASAAKVRAAIPSDTNRPSRAGVTDKAIPVNAPPQRARTWWELLRS